MNKHAYSHYLKHSDKWQLKDYQTNKVIATFKNFNELFSFARKNDYVVHARQLEQHFAKIFNKEELDDGRRTEKKALIEWLVKAKTNMTENERAIAFAAFNAGWRSAVKFLENRQAIRVVTSK